MSDQKDWHKIAESISDLQVNQNGLTEIEVAGKKICLARKADQLFACTQKCPHAGGILSEGYLDVHGHIVCPIHRYKFDPVNGHNVSGEGYFLKTFPVQIRSEGVFIGLMPVF